MTQIIKKCFLSTLLSSLAVLFFVVFFTGRDRDRVRTFRSEGGWGYYVTARDRIVVWQPYIPAIEGKKPFATRNDARKAGKIVQEKINFRKNPSVNIEELTEAGISI